MIIFNSLGSNYSFREAFLALRELLIPNQSAKKQLKKYLSNHFQGKTVLLFNGRDAIEYCLEAYGISKGDTVLTQAFSCSSLEEAINRTGATAEYFDLDSEALHTSLKQIEKAYQAATKPKAIILQHTLGYADQVQEIAKFCKEKRIILIEDLAQAVGAVDDSGVELGSLADAVILSFGRDKLLDGVSGGAVVFKHHSIEIPTLPKLEDWFELKHDKSNKKLVVRLLFYPLLTLVIRHTYSIGLGKVLHWLAKKTGLMETQIKSPHGHYQSFPAYFAPLVLRQWNGLHTQLANRSFISSIYWNKLHEVEGIKIPLSPEKIARGTNLRFPVVLSSSLQVKTALSFLQKNGIFLNDRWYRAAVDSGSLQFQSNYQLGNCPNAENYAKLLINLPTHRVVTIKKAEKIAELVIKSLQDNHG